MCLPAWLPACLADVAHARQAGSTPHARRPIAAVGRPSVEVAKLLRRDAGLEVGRVLRQLHVGGARGRLGALSVRGVEGSGSSRRAVADAVRIDACVGADDQRATVGEHRIHIAGGTETDRLISVLLFEPGQRPGRRRDAPRAVVQLVEFGVQRVQRCGTLGRRHGAARHAFARFREGRFRLGRIDDDRSGSRARARFGAGGAGSVATAAAAHHPGRRRERDPAQQIAPRQRW